MPDFSIVKVEDTHKAIKATKNAVPKTIEAVDSIVSSTINILGYVPNTINEYMKHSLDKTRAKLHQKLDGVPAEKIVPPPVHIAAPALQAACHVADCEELHNMFASLLATAMNYDSQNLAHPAFTQIIENLSPLEAKILTTETFDIGYHPMISLRIQNVRKGPNSSIIKHEFGEDYRLAYTGFPIVEHMVAYKSLADLSITQLVLSSSITNNFHRLGLFDFPQGTHVSKVEHYVKITEALKNYIAERSKVEKLPPDREYAIVPEAFILTEFGKQFIAACVR